MLRVSDTPSIRIGLLVGDGVLVDVLGDSAQEREGIGGNRFDTLGESRSNQRTTDCVSNDVSDLWKFVLLSRVVGVNELGQHCPPVSLCCCIESVSERLVVRPPNIVIRSCRTGGIVARCVGEDGFVFRDSSIECRYVALLCVVYEIREVTHKVGMVLFDR
ncbi:hypothetical protein BRC81_11140 [Halobacteriales archaeon QS_1_68_20]|nr:MAG: hypothetical protein BRC81_11140 [Halobacteriales archaeon QS_1_68_20]